MCSNDRSLLLTPRRFRSLHQDEIKFGDQAAFNLVLYEWPVRNGNIITLHVLHPLDFPPGSIFFDLHSSVYLNNPKNMAKIVHNNFLIGTSKKIQRFKDHGMWLIDRIDDIESYSYANFTFLNSSVPTIPLTASDPSCQDNTNSNSNSDPSDYFYPYRNQPLLLYKHTTNPKNRVILSISTGGDRTWFDRYNLPRLRDYALSVGADLLVVRRQFECDIFNKLIIENKVLRDELKIGVGRDDHDIIYHDCVKAAKVRISEERSDELRMSATGHRHSTPTHPLLCSSLRSLSQVRIWREALEHFSSVLYVDDTVVVARNSPDIFSIVGKGNLGVVGEKGTRTDEENDAFKRVICYLYGCFGDGPFLKDPSKRLLLDR